MSTTSPIRLGCLTLVLITGLGVATPVLAAEPTAADLEFFEKRVRPLLVEQCHKCHGGGKQESGLRLDTREGVERGGEGGPVVDRKTPAASRLLEVVGYTGEIRMPPKGRLSEGELAILTEWVERGAPFPQGGSGPAAGDFDLAARKAKQWALQPVQPQSPPPVAHPEWVANEVDQFVVARLEAERLAPGPVVDRRVLLRRLSFDLIGLPPTAEELEAFATDESPQAVEKVIDRLLASPRYGERWARHWLDLVRYAETSGHEFDFEIGNAWQYRDYVIRALNADVPYNQWVLEHVAGDLLPEPRRHPTERFNESILGTGFWFLGESKHSPVDIRVDAAERLDNQLDVFSKTFLGQTVACARCHDHKFDAISTADYHALAGFVQSSRQQQAWIDDPADRGAAIGQLRDLAAARSRLAKESAAAGWRAARGALRPQLLAALRVLRPATVDAEPQPAASQPATVQPAGKLIDGGATNGDAAGADQLFEDFERDTYAPWVASGSAFAGVPNRLPLPDYQGDVNAVGKRLVNSHSVLTATGERQAGDQFTGKLVSPPFSLTRPYIHLLVGGGAHVGKTCVNLVVADQVVRSVTGKNQNRMEWATLDVADLRGREARLEIVDNEAGGWGNIGVDQIVFSLSPLPGKLGQALLAEARATQIPVERLAATVHWLVESGRRAVPGPPGLLARWANRPGPPTPDDWKRFQAESQTAATPAAAPPATDKHPAEPVVELRAGEWYPAGEAFEFVATRGEEIPATGVLPAATPGGQILHSGRLSRRLQGAVRSRSFVISHPRLWCQVLGQGTRIRLVIDQFQQIRYPIYGGLEFAINSPESWHWHAQDVSKWVGHSAYLEVLDEGEGFAALAAVVAADQPPPPSSLPAAPGAAGDSPDRLVERVVEWGDQGAEWLTEAGEDTPPASSPAGARPNPATTNRSADSDPRWGAGQWLLHELWTPGVTLWSRPEAWQTRQVEWSRQLQAGEAQIAYHRRALAMADGSAQNEAIHPRGNPNRFGELVPRRLLESLQGTEPVEYGPHSGRLTLARQLIDPGNPLVCRVLVNRVWKQHFGEGLVATPDDFGNMGQRPTHPELLDWLVTEFQARGWSLKQLHRLLLLSRTYALASTPGSEAVEEADPLNRLWHRAQLRRLEAETIRDAILAVSGRLNLTEEGPPVLPHLTPFMIGRGRPGQSGPLDGDGRRSVYLAVRRNFLNPMFQAFDAPVPFSTIGRRLVSNVPAQALSLLNNPFVLQQAGLWARRVREQPGSPADKIRRMYVSAFARDPTDEELHEALEYVTTGSDPERVWEDLAHVLFNVKEFVWIP